MKYVKTFENYKILENTEIKSEYKIGDKISYTDIDGNTITDKIFDMWFSKKDNGYCIELKKTETILTPKDQIEFKLKKI